MLAWWQECQPSEGSGQLLGWTSLDDSKPAINRMIHLLIYIKEKHNTSWAAMWSNVLTEHLEQQIPVLKMFA